MRFTSQARFDSEFKALPADHKKMFLSLIPEFNAACEAYLADPGGFTWPKKLRVKQMSSAKGIWELTWSFSGPDGRATFEFFEIDGEPGVRWRRIGRHEIFREP